MGSGHRVALEHASAKSGCHLAVWRFTSQEFGDARGCSSNGDESSLLAQAVLQPQVTWTLFEQTPAKMRSHLAGWCFVHPTNEYRSADVEDRYRRPSSVAGFDADFVSTTPARRIDIGGTGP